MFQIENGVTGTAFAPSDRRSTSVGPTSRLRLCSVAPVPRERGQTAPCCFESTIYLRLPRRWTVEALSPIEGRTRYVARAPSGREALLVYSLPGRTGGKDLSSRARRLRRAAGALADTRFLAARGWTGTRYETLPVGDLLLRGERCDDGEIRIVQWMRFSLRSDATVVSIFQLATIIDRAEEVVQRRSLDTVERAIRAAAILMPDR